MSADTWRARFMRGECDVHAIHAAIQSWQLDPFVEVSLPESLGLSSLEYTFFVHNEAAFKRAMLREFEEPR